jgi:hypothetical protein
MCEVKDFIGVSDVEDHVNAGSNLWQKQCVGGRELQTSASRAVLVWNAQITILPSYSVI